MQVQLIIAAIIAVLAFGGGYRTKSIIVDARHAAELQAEIDAKMAWIKYGDEQSEKLEKALAKQRAASRNLNQKVSNETASNDVYRALLPASGVLLYNQAIEGETTSKSDSPVRPLDTTPIPRNGWRTIFPFNNDN